MDQVREERQGEQETHTPWLEWLAAGVGLLLVAGMFGFLGWQALDDPTTPPVIVVEIGAVTAVDRGYRVEFRAHNRAGSVAAQVEIEGRITGSGGVAETSSTTFDYIPGHSSREGGLFFTRDPRSADLTVRASGFAKP